GKGSTAAMLESCLRAAGHRTGLYTSPHLHSFRERIQVGGKPVSEEDLAAIVSRCQAALDATPGVTTFEGITAIAFAYFAQQGVEWAVVEVGLGGRLDATNVILPEVCAITSISYDHMHILGNTLALIAREKAGIIKHGIPVVCAPQVDEARVVFEEICRERQAPLTLVGRDWWWETDGAQLQGQAFRAGKVTRRSRSGAPPNDGRQPTAPEAVGNYWIPLLGRHQLANATGVLAILDILRGHGVRLPDEAVRRGLATVRWPGRMEVLRAPDGEPPVVVDGAQNADSALKLCEALAEWFPGRGIALVFGVSSDHDIPGMLNHLLPAVRVAIVTRSRHPRAADPARLVSLIEAHPSRPPELRVTTSVQDALAEAVRLARADEVICATGSLFVVAEAREAWLAGHPEALPADDWARAAAPEAIPMR
ncbi:MAG: bifunctional folylpolyglutamate synthase/dihydrofolate synthase, partial [Anaerolineae bacterium]|nr:bifunctional folylpolyglutamate synthase/dihydrofolate synthase [Anaerolineae bacterium]